MVRIQYSPLFFDEMYYTYVLYSPGSNKIYVGQTSDLNHRMETHNSIENKGWTNRYSPWELLYREEFHTRSEAMIREKQLKSAKGRMFIREILGKRILEQHL
jgi:putative endonuclease